MDDPIMLVIVLGVVLPLVVVLLVGAVLVTRDTIRKRGRWGVNAKGLAGVPCPRCGEPLPAVRVPENLNQTLWGGATCEECGCEVDKWGREVEGDR